MFEGCNKQEEINDAVNALDWEEDLTISEDKIVLKLHDRSYIFDQPCDCKALHKVSDERWATMNAHELAEHLRNAVDDERFTAWLKARAVRKNIPLTGYEDDLDEVFGLGSAFFDELRLKLTINWEVKLTTVTIE